MNRTLIVLGLIARLLFVLGALILVISTLPQTTSTAHAIAAALTLIMITCDTSYLLAMRRRRLVEERWLLADAMLASNGIIVIGFVCIIRLLGAQVDWVLATFIGVIALFAWRIRIDMRHLAQSTFPAQGSAIAFAKETFAAARRTHLPKDSTPGE